MKNKKVNVVIGQGEEPLPFELLQKEIIKLSNVGKQIQQSKLTQRAIVLLLQDMTKLPQSSIKYILNALPELEKKYIRRGA